MPTLAISNADLHGSGNRPARGFESLMLAGQTRRIANDPAMMMAELETCRVG